MSTYLTSLRQILRYLETGVPFSAPNLEGPLLHLIARLHVAKVSDLLGHPDSEPWDFPALTEAGFFVLPRLWYAEEMAAGQPIAPESFLPTYVLADRMATLCGIRNPQMLAAAQSAARLISFSSLTPH